MENIEFDENGKDDKNINKEFLKRLLEMGIPEETALHALRMTNSESLEAAAACALELSQSESENEEWEDLDEDFKMVFIVNSGLNMSPGKIAAQVAHAAIHLYKSLMGNAEECVRLACWQDAGEKKIVLKGEDEAELLALKKKAIEMKVVHSEIRDAGLTEIPPDSLTVLGLFGDEGEVNKLSGNLKLL